MRGSKLEALSLNTVERNELGMLCIGTACLTTGTARTHHLGGRPTIYDGLIGGLPFCSIFCMGVLC